MREPVREGIVDAMTTTLTRPKNKRVIAGVCAGLAERFNTKPAVVRLLFVLSCLLPGPQFLIYIVLWIMMPSRDH
jgi:phage shock protein PspC (stress-responsive transcriptional regulator)